jgi:ribosomal protein L19
MIEKLKSEIQKLKNEVESIAALLNSINEKGQNALNDITLNNIDLRTIELIEKIVINKMSTEDIEKLKKHTKQLVDENQNIYNKGKDDYNKYYGNLIDKKNELSRKETEFRKAVNNDIIDNNKKYSLNVDKLKQAKGKM